MKKWRIEYAGTYRSSPLSFWVHRHLDSEVWHLATEYEPSLPKAVPAKGYPVLFVDALGVELQFSSIDEVEHFIAVISRKNMPTPLQLTQQRNADYGPNAHWLSRLPAKLKPWSKREKILPILQSALNELKSLYS